MARYSKFFGSIIGGAVGILFAWLASQGIGSCVGEGDAQVCSVFGISQETVTAALVMAFGSLGTYIFPSHHVTT